MKSNRAIIHYTLFAALIGIVSFDANAALRVGNHSRSYAEAYQQVNSMRNQNTATVPQAQMQPAAPVVVTPSTDTENNLPVHVSDADLANQIATGDRNSAAFNQLTQCAMIYPNGEFAWDNPTLGRGAGGADTCVAVVELRGYQAAPDGSDVVLARATLAAGDTVRCNISEFPEASMVPSAVENFVFPADAEPTMDDVIAQMNQEQNQNAGLKIAAGALIGGLGGNLTGANDRGNDNLLGTDRGKMQNTLIGAVIGSAVMAGNTYAGKVAGDTILSTGVNAAAGSVIGNMSGTGDSVLRIEKCSITENNVERETSCLWGALVTSTSLAADEIAFYNIDTDETYVCDSGFKNCKSENLVSIFLDAYPDTDIDDVDRAEMLNLIRSDANQQYYMAINNGITSFVPASDVTSVSGVDTSRGIFTKIKSAGRIDRQIPALIEMRDRAFGMKQSDWREWRRDNGGVVKIYGRSSDGNGYVLPATSNAKIQNFYPMMVDAADGSLIDFGNKARLKSTLIGAGVGGALGGFAGYQGAQLDVQNRWVAAVREYEDSLTKVYCATGNRYLSAYNDTVFIPNMTTASTSE